MRSRKAVGRGFIVRHDQREKESKKKKASSNFYFLYPSRDVAAQTTKTSKECFSLYDNLLLQDLIQKVKYLHH